MRKNSNSSSSQHAGATSAGSGGGGNGGGVTASLLRGRSSRPMGVPAATIQNDSESYSSNSSYTETSSYSDSSDLANWEEYVAEDGSLFYAEYLPQMQRKSNTMSNTMTPSTKTHHSRLSGNSRTSSASTQQQQQQQQQTNKTSTWRVGKKLLGVATNASSGGNNNGNNTRRGHHSQQQQQQQQQKKQQTPVLALHEELRESKRSSITATNTTEFDKYKFTHIQPLEGSPASAIGVCKQLEMIITSTNRFRFGRRSTATESILGFRVAPYTDRPECLMVVDFVHDMQHHVPPPVTGDGGSTSSPPSPLTPTPTSTPTPPIQRGDWFRSLDDIEVRASNVNELLLQFAEPTKVRLRFQGPACSGVTDSTDGTTQRRNSIASGNGNTDWRKVENFNMFASVFEQFILPSNMVKEELHQASLVRTSPIPASPTPAQIPTTPTTPAMPFGLLILPPECYQLDEHKDSLYFYPEDATNNFLYKTRGSFLTLHAVLSKELRTQPHTSRLCVENTPYFVTYRTHNSLLVLCAYAENYQSLAECGLRTDELHAYLRFTLPALTHQQLANTTDATEAVAVRQHLRHFCEIQRIRLLAAHRRCSVQFEELLRESRMLALPKEAQLRIFDALSEMEAMDYRNWNAEPLRTHREFFMHGSALYCDHWLLTAQLPVEVRAHVDAFLRCTGIFDFMAADSVRVRELCVWQEISMDLDSFDSEMDLMGGVLSEPTTTTSTTTESYGRYFLCICSRGHLLLAVVLRLFDAPDLLPNAHIPPSLFYIEEIQETLEHLVQCGIESLALFWSVSNKRPEVWSRLDLLGDIGATGTQQSMSEQSTKDGNRLETFIKQKLSTSGNPTATLNCEEEMHLCSSLGGSSVHSATPSEEDLNRRRLNAANNNLNNSNSNNHNNNTNNNSTSGTPAGDFDSDSGGSDWEHFGEQLNCGTGGVSSATADAESHITVSMNSLLPINISGGGAWKNALFHYVCVDYANGTVTCPLRANSDSFPHMADMRRAFHAVREILQRTRLSRAGGNCENTSASAIGGSGIDNGVQAVKEYGITVAVPDKTTAAGSGSSSNNNEFTVVGRLFTAPLKEVYICHHPDVPQNMVEIAFRLSFFPAG